MVSFPNPRRRPARAVNSSTLHHVFVLPRPANASNTKFRTRKVSKRNTKKRSGTVNRKSATRAAKPKLTDDQKRELRRVRAAEERQRRKELGLCRIARTLPSRQNPLPRLRRKAQQPATLREVALC